MSDNSSSPDQVSINMSPAVFQSLITAAAAPPPAPLPAPRTPSKVNCLDVPPLEDDGDDFLDLLGEDVLFDNIESENESENAQFVSSDVQYVSSDSSIQLSPLELPTGGRAVPVQQLTLDYQVVHFHKSCRQAGFYVKNHPDEFPDNTLSAGQHRQRIGIASKKMVPEYLGFLWEPILYPGQVMDVTVSESPPRLTSARSLDSDFFSSAVPSSDRGKTSRVSCKTRRFSPTWEASIKKKRSSKPLKYTIGTEFCLGHDKTSNDQTLVTLVGCPCTIKQPHCMACLNSWFQHSQTRKCMNCNMPYTGFNF